MGNSGPEHNGRSITRWFNQLRGKDASPAAPATPAKAVETPAYSPIVALSNSLPTRRDGLDKSLKFVIEHKADGATITGNEFIERFLNKMSEQTLRALTEFIDDKENGFIVRSLCASAVSGMSFRYRERTTDYGIDYTQLHNLMLLGEDFQRTTPENNLTAIRSNIDFTTVKDLTFRFHSLMDEIKPQNLSKTPDFSIVSEREQRAARVALVIANVYYTGADSSQRHRESELLACVDRHFDRRFEITSILHRHMDATPRMIDENMDIESSTLQDGWL